MADKLENNESSQNYVELKEIQIFEKIREDLNPIQENLAEKKMTINEAKSELKKINDWIKGTKLENKDKKEIGKAFEKLTKLEKNVDENTLRDEVEGIVKLLENLTKRDLKGLKQDIQGIKHQQPIERPVDVQEGIKKASENLNLTIENASEDTNPIANRIGKAMKWLNS